MGCSNRACSGRRSKSRAKLALTPAITARIRRLPLSFPNAC
jgi:hypothetical protein